MLYFYKYQDRFSTNINREMFKHTVSMVSQTEHLSLHLHCVIYNGHWKVQERNGGHDLWANEVAWEKQIASNEIRSSSRFY